MAFIERTYVEIAGEGGKQLGLSSLQSRLEMLDNYWAKFEATHEKLISVGGKVDVQIVPYFKDNQFDTTFSHFTEATALLHQLIEKKGVSSSSRRSTMPSLDQYSTTSRYVPEIALPKFCRQYSQWRSFKDLFSAVIGSNASLSNVERMYFLRSSLTGEATHIIANLPLSDDSFASAWDSLHSRYEKKRLLVSAHLEQLLNPPAMSAHNAQELNALLSDVSEARNALEALDSPVGHWDQVIVHTVTNRLSSKLREAWEVWVGSSNDYPTFTNFKDFLTGRACAMESIEITSTLRAPTTKASHASSSKQSTSARVHHGTAQPQGLKPARRPAPRSAATGKVTYPCSMSEADHHLTSCSSFHQLTVPARREVVERRYLCYNCLGRHSVRDCRSKTKCQYCGGLHHSMLHNQPSSQPQRPAQQRPQNRSVQQKAVPVVTYSHENGAPREVTVDQGLSTSSE